MGSVINGDLQSLGQMLRAAREAQALSLQEVEAQTRIRAKFLQALEEGDLSVLPSVIHAKGFLRNYAQFLHLDVNEVIARFAAATGSAISPPTSLAAPPADLPPASPTSEAQTDEGERPPAPPLLPHTRSKPRAVYVAPERRSGPALPMALARARQEIAQPTRPQQPPSLPVRVLRSGFFAAGVLLIGFVAVVWWAVASLSAISGEELVPPEQESAVLAQLVGSATIAPSPTFRPTSTPEPGSGLGIMNRVLVSIEVQQPTWVRVVVDGDTVFEGQAKPGTILRYEGREEIFIRTGNGAGLVVTYNGQVLGPLGGRGEVVERFFTLSGQITPTPTPTVTPTNTSVPTPTPSLTPTP